MPGVPGRLTQREVPDFLELARTTVTALEKGEGRIRPDELIKPGPGCTDARSALSSDSGPRPAGDHPAASEPQREERGLALYQGHTGSLAFRVIGGGVVRGL